MEHIQPSSTCRPGPQLSQCSLGLLFLLRSGAHPGSLVPQHHILIPSPAVSSAQDELLPNWGPVGRWAGHWREGLALPYQVSLPPGLQCNASVDLIGTCWPRSPAGQLVVRPCPAYFYGVRYNTTSKGAWRVGHLLGGGQDGESVGRVGAGEIMIMTVTIPLLGTATIYEGSGGHSVIWPILTIPPENPVYNSTVLTV